MFWLMIFRKKLCWETVWNHYTIVSCHIGSFFRWAPTHTRGIAFTEKSKKKKEKSFCEEHLQQLVYISPHQKKAGNKYRFKSPQIKVTTLHGRWRKRVAVTVNAMTKEGDVKHFVNICSFAFDGKERLRFPLRKEFHHTRVCMRSRGDVLGLSWSPSSRWCITGRLAPPNRIICCGLTPHWDDISFKRGDGGVAAGLHSHRPLLKQQLQYNSFMSWIWLQPFE